MRLRVLVLALVAIACFGDPPPAAEDLPLEIVFHPDECHLNYPQVGPGTHEVTIIYEGTSGSVSIVDGDEAVFTSDGASAGSVNLEVGDYLVVCQADGLSMSTPLAVREGLPSGGG